ncbi:MAG TPA: transcription elongation factor Spt5 [archaeon]|nr:transcription elongation factor Spt5 [archaeon]
MSFFGIRTTVGRENLTTDVLEMRIEHEKIPIYSLLVIPGIKGYIISESDNEREVVDAIRGDAKMIKDPLADDDIFKLLKSEPVLSEIKEGQKIEILGGPFKGARAKILRINKTKEEVTIELLEGTIPIPITIRADFIRPVD